jgi:thiamine biosynthesis protein ThiS
MQIVLNGEPRMLKDGQTLADLLAVLNVAPQRVAIERNRVLVRRADYAQTPLREGDQIEVVTLVGGG